MEELKSFSQFKQDAIALNFLQTHGTRNGFFVEVGAHNGVEFSNTLMMEQLGWQGVCIEPNPESFPILRDNRRCFCSNAAISDVEDTEVEFVVCGMLSGCLDTIDRYPHVKTSRTVRVRTKTLTSVLDSVNAPKEISYLSIDVEGGEMAVLRGIDFNKYRFRFLTIEHNGLSEKRQEIKSVLMREGYIYWGAIGGIDDAYFYPSYKICP